MNLAGLRIQVDRRTGKAQAVQAANSFINEAINIINSKREWPWADQLQTITTTTATVYPVSSDYSETRTLNVDGVEAQQVYIADADQFGLTVNVPSVYVYSIEWTDGVAQLQMFPQPPVGTTALHRYTRTEALLSGDSDEPLMPERYHSIIADLASSLFLERIEPARSEFYNQRTKQAIKDMTEATQRKSNPGRIRIRPGEAF